MQSARCVHSPDGTRSVFIRDWNLWVRDTATGKETALTTDGVKDFGYATDNAGWTRSDRPIVVWSPDSTQVATYQQDQRNVGEMYLVRTRVGHPELQAWKYPLPGDDATHDVTLPDTGEYFVDSYSAPERAPTTVLRDVNGRLILTLEKADISRLVAIGWKPPTPFVVKARDNQTDLYGLMFKPASLDPSRKYPIINKIYPGPQTGSVGSRTFAAARGDNQALAELGFIVVQIDGMGTPWRSKKFHEAYFGDMGDNTLPDQVAGMKQLAQRFPFIDIDRAGIWGHSGGGYATAGAMFRYPDFFKVGIAESGNHDNRVYEDDWAEKWMGLLEKKPDGTSNYDAQANQPLAKNLKGHLLLVHGTMDSNVPPENTLLVAQALIEANKDFDMLMLPNQAHGYGSMSDYMTRRRWDYFVRYLMGAEPPHEYEMHKADSSATP